MSTGMTNTSRMSPMAPRPLYTPATRSAAASGAMDDGTVYSAQNSATLDVSGKQAGAGGRGSPQRADDTERRASLAAEANEQQQREMQRISAERVRWAEDVEHEHQAQLESEQRRTVVARQEANAKLQTAEKRAMEAAQQARAATTEVQEARMRAEAQLASAAELGRAREESLRTEVAEELVRMQRAAQMEAKAAVRIRKTRPLPYFNLFHTHGGVPSGDVCTCRPGERAP